MATIELPGCMRGAAWRASVRNARAFAFSVQSQWRSSSSSAGRITPVAAFETSTSSASISSMNDAAFAGSPTFPRRSSASAPRSRISPAVSSAAESLRR